MVPVGYGWLFVFVLALGFLVLEVLGGLQSRSTRTRAGNTRRNGAPDRDDRLVRGKRIATLGATPFQGPVGVTHSPDLDPRTSIHAASERPASTSVAIDTIDEGA